MTDTMNDICARLSKAEDGVTILTDELATIDDKITAAEQRDASGTFADYLERGDLALKVHTADDLRVDRAAVGKLLTAGRLTVKRLRTELRDAEAEDQRAIEAAMTPADAITATTALLDGIDLDAMTRRLDEIDAQSIALAPRRASAAETYEAACEANSGHLRRMGGASDAAADRQRQAFKDAEEKARVEVQNLANDAADLIADHQAARDDVVRRCKASLRHVRRLASAHAEGLATYAKAFTRYAELLEHPASLTPMPEPVDTRLFAADDMAALIWRIEGILKATRREPVKPAIPERRSASIRMTPGAQRIAWM